MPSAPSRLRTRLQRVIPLLLATVGAIALLVGLGIVVPANAAPYINCNKPAYNGAISATVKCDAASVGKVRLAVRCFSGPVVTATKNTAWVKIPAGSTRTLKFTSNGWCGGFLQQWVVTPQIATL